MDGQSDLIVGRWLAKSRSRRLVESMLPGNPQGKFPRVCPDLGFVAEMASSVLCYMFQTGCFMICLNMCLRSDV